MGQIDAPKAHNLILSCGQKGVVQTCITIRIFLVNLICMLGFPCAVIFLFLAEQILPKKLNVFEHVPSSLLPRISTRCRATLVCSTISAATTTQERSALITAPSTSGYTSD
jgi:hypothetical protein